MAAGVAFYGATGGLDNHFQRLANRELYMIFQQEFLARQAVHLQLWVLLYALFRQAIQLSEAQDLRLRIGLKSINLIFRRYRLGGDFVCVFHILCRKISKTNIIKNINKIKRLFLEKRNSLFIKKFTSKVKQPL